MVHALRISPYQFASLDRTGDVWHTGEEVVARLLVLLVWTSSTRSITPMLILTGRFAA